MSFCELLLATFVSLLFLSRTVQAMHGQATWYNTGIGACGAWNLNKERVVALPPLEYAGGTRCGRTIRVHYQGRSTRARVVDLCPSCGFTGIDLSPSAFQALAPLDVGVLQVTWEYI